MRSPFSKLEDGLILSPQNPDGIPIHKIFSFFYWAQDNHPLGYKWTFSPENYTMDVGTGSKNTYLGYSVQPSCYKKRRRDGESEERDAYVPTEKRWPLQAYTMAKKWSYFAHQSSKTAWTLDYFQAVHEATAELSKTLPGSPFNSSSTTAAHGQEEEMETGLRTLIGIKDDRSDPENAGMTFPTELPPAMTNVGLLKQEDFVDTIAKTRVLIGIGKPIT